MRQLEIGVDAMLKLGIDLGGTNIKAGVTDKNGRLLGKGLVETRHRGAGAIINDAAQLCFGVLDKAGIGIGEIETVGAGVPGSFNSKTGLIEFCPALDLSGVPIAKMLGEKLGKRIFIENDANLAALAEYALGSGRGAKSLVAVTLGTGIGGGIIIDGRIHEGCNQAGGEIGHMVISQGGEKCSCGRSGCFEAYASAAALKRQTKEMMLSYPDSLMWSEAGSMENVNGTTAFAAAGKNDEAAIMVLERYFSYLACGLTSIINIFQPEVLCIGGGLSNEGEGLLKPLREIIDKEDYARHSEIRTKVVLTALGNDAGIIGAALLPEWQ